MSTCLQHIFENPLPEKPTLIETLSWNQLKHVNSIKHSSSCTEIFGELHFKENPQPQPSSPSPSSSDSSPLVCSSSSFSEIIDSANFIQNEVPDSSSNIDQTPLSSFFTSNTSATITTTTTHAKGHKSSDSFSSLSYESLHLCTEGLGFESSDDVEDSKNWTMNESWETQEGEKEASKNYFASENSHGECRGRSRVNGAEYPPPISSIGRRSGKPWVSFRSYRNNGRFVLEEIRVPKQDFLHAHREDGRLKLRFVQPEEESLEEEEEEMEQEEEEDCDGVEIADVGEENMGKESDENVTDEMMK